MNNSISQNDLDPALRRKLTDLQDEGFEIWRRFDIEVRQQTWHPFIPVEYEDVLQMLLAVRGPGRKFLEWGSATGVITIMADLLGFEAYGIIVITPVITIMAGLLGFEAYRSEL